MGTEENSGNLNRVNSFSRNIFEMNACRIRAINITSGDSLLAKVNKMMFCYLLT